tara:strand:+ start:2339 stop:2851 length:513 start_codon:yes stop_codon:yes gene_type:complete
MRLGNKIKFLAISLIIVNQSLTTFAEDKITSSPLINLEKLKPSFEEVDEKNENIVSGKKLKQKKSSDNIKNNSHAILIGLDKITAKSSKISVNLDEVKKFGPLEIKILKCEKIKVNNKINDVAYMQVKDLSKSNNDKVFIFNGWTFSSDPSLTPFDHAIYDLQLLNCYNV